MEPEKPACVGRCMSWTYVMVRMPNIAEALLIFAVFFYGKLSGEKAADMWKNAGACVAGFLLGFAGVFLAICIQYGPGAYFGMFGSLAGYTSTDESYSPFFHDYLDSFRIWRYLNLAYGNRRMYIGGMDIFPYAAVSSGEGREGALLPVYPHFDPAFLGQGDVYFYLL